MAKVKICETVLRDAHQSLIATRMTTDEIVPILPVMDKIGYAALECWGGATFDACLRFLHEDPWERLRRIRQQVKTTKLQMLFRGQNILGYRHYADDVVEYFVQKSVANGIDIIRIFDALNDIRNLTTSIHAAKKEGAHVQAAISYTTGPVFNISYFVGYAKQLEEMGANSICIKDMAGLLTPYAAAELVDSVKRETNLPVELHTHSTTGLGSMTLLKAVEAGCDIIDTAISPFALGTSQPPTESIVAALHGTEFDTGLDLHLLDEVCRYFTPLREKYMACGLLDPKVLKVNVNALLYQVPGGMLSNLISQLKQQGKSDLLGEVLEEVPRVRADAGYPPLVTPTSQIVGTQAVLNVLAGERYRMISKEFKGLIRGEYGRTPVPVEPVFVRKIIGNEPVITCRPADRLKPELDTLRQHCAPFLQQEEDVLTYALFEQVAEKFFIWRREQQLGIDAETSDSVRKVHPI